MGHRRKEDLTAEQIRERVSQLMDGCQSCPDFAHLFDALLRATGGSDRVFAREYTQATGEYTSPTKVDQIRNGHCQPPYDFVANIADHVLLSLDPERLRPASGSLPPGDHRIALFAAAGFIEVTPDSIRHWNEEVLAGWQRQCEDPTRPRLIWRELMSKLVGFHCQGGRCSHKDIARAANALSGPGSHLDGSRIDQLLANTRTVPTRSERLALAKAAGLSQSQAHFIELAVDQGILPLVAKPSFSPFSTQLDDLLARLGAAGISQRQLVSRTVPPGQADPELTQSSLSVWKNNKTKPTQASLRTLVRALEQCRDKAGRPLVQPEELRQLVVSAGFTLEELAATTHDIVARIAHATRLKPLLVALRNAVDLNVPMSAVEDLPAGGDLGSNRMRLSVRRHWELDSSSFGPTPAQVRELLAVYNRLLREKGQAELSPEEIEKVAEVAQRDRDDGLRRGFRQRAAEHRPPSPRRTITPDFDGSTSR